MTAQLHQANYQNYLILPFWQIVNFVWIIHRSLTLHVLLLTVAYVIEHFLKVDCTSFLKCCHIAGILHKKVTEQYCHKSVHIWTYLLASLTVAKTFV